MKLVILFSASLWLLSCNKEDKSEPTAKKLLRKEVTTHNGTLLVTAYNYDDQGRMVAIKTGVNNDPLQPDISISYIGYEVEVQFQPYTDSVSATARQLRLTLNAAGKPVTSVFFANQVYYSQPSDYNASSFTMDFTYDAAGFLKTVSNRRVDTSYRPGSSWSSRRSFTSQYITVDGKLVTMDQYGQRANRLVNSSGISTDTRTFEYHGIYSYTKLHPNTSDCSNAAILNQLAYDGTSQYTAVNPFEPLADAQYRYMPDRTQIQFKEVDGYGNTTIGFNGDVEVSRTYNSSGMLETTETITPNQATTKIRYFYGQ